MASPCAARVGAALALAGALLLTGCSTASTSAARTPAPLASSARPSTAPPPTSARPTPTPIATSAPSITPDPPTFRVPGWWRPKVPDHPNQAGRAFANFHAAAGTLDGLVLSGTRLVGTGVGRAVLRMRPHTSTHASDVPSTFPRTNQLSLVRLRSTVGEFAGFTIQGTAQGHLYNGLRVDRAQHIRVHDIRIAGIPGSASTPPGETFGLNDYRTNGARYTRVEIDGAGRGAAGFGANGSSDITIRDSYSHDNRYSMGFAFWHVRNITISRSIAMFNGRAGFNFERVSGSVLLDRVVMLGNRHPISIASDQGSATYRIVDPTFPGPTLEVHLPRTYYGAKNEQRRGDIHLIVRGRDRSDLIRFT